MQTMKPAPGYGLSQPNAQDILAALLRLVGQDESSRLWTASCRQAGISPSSTLTLDQLGRALQQLKQEKGLATIVANSMLVRISSFRTLSTINSK